MARPVGHRARQEQKLLDLLTRLLKRRKFCNPGTAWLAKKMNVSPRSIERYVASLKGQGKLQASYRKRLFGERWVTKRYCRPITEEYRPTWVPTSWRNKSAAPSAPPAVVKVSSSWAKPWYGADEDHPNAKLAAVMAQVAATKAIPARAPNPKAEEAARRRLLEAERNPNFYRRT
jgi:hypothetical protein